MACIYYTDFLAAAADVSSSYNGTYQNHCGSRVSNFFLFFRLTISLCHRLICLLQKFIYNSFGRVCVSNYIINYLAKTFSVCGWNYSPCNRKWYAAFRRIKCLLYLNFFRCTRCFHGLFCSYQSIWFSSWTFVCIPNAISNLVPKF